MVQLNTVQHILQRYLLIQCHQYTIYTNKAPKVVHVELTESHKVHIIFPNPTIKGFALTSSHKFRTALILVIPLDITYPVTRQEMAIIIHGNKTAKVHSTTHS